VTIFKQEEQNIDLARQIAEIDAEIESEKRRRQGMLQEQVHKENKIRRLRDRVNEIKYDKYQEADEKL
jgi:hypothetical protein